MDLTESIVARSDQINADDLIGGASTGAPPPHPERENR
jgi:hypothetical protein